MALSQGPLDAAENVAGTRIVPATLATFSGASLLLAVSLDRRLRKERRRSPAEVRPPSAVGSCSA